MHRLPHSMNINKTGAICNQQKSRVSTVAPEFSCVIHNPSFRFVGDIHQHTCGETERVTLESGPCKIYIHRDV
jgi:hypothetical protein